MEGRPEGDRHAGRTQEACESYHRRRGSARLTAARAQPTGCGERRRSSNSACGGGDKGTGWQEARLSPGRATTNGTDLENVLDSLGLFLSL